MGRIRSLASLNKAVEYATARQTYYSTPRPGKTTVETNPKDTVIYVASSLKVGTAAANVQIQASAASITKFGTLAALGLLATATDSIRAPRGFKPAKIHGMIGTDTPTAGVSPVSGRRVIKYSASSAGDAKANFTAPIGGETTEVQRSAFTLIATAKAAEFKSGPGGYGRIWFTPEYLSFSG